jgi:aminopeptidase N
MDIAITTPDIYTSSSNGLLVDEKLSNGSRTTYWKHRYPIATYLVAFAVTNYSIINDDIKLGNITLPIVDYAYPENETAFRNAGAITKRTMELLHNTFTPYPFIKEKYGHTQFGFGGGMEHQTNSFMFNMDETLIVHELAHQWFGNKITCGSWRDIWLNEGFAIYCTNLNIEKNYPEANLINLYKSQVNFITSKPTGSVYVDDTTSVGRIFDSRLSYNKGGWVLQMLRWKLGDSVFYRAVRNYLNDPKVNFSYALTTDLKKQFEQESKKDLTEFFKDWVYGQGFPSYKLQWAPAGNSWVNISLSQTTSDTSVKFFEMPVPIRFKNIARDTIIVIDHIKNNQASFINIGFIADSAFIDPKVKLISANNSVVKTEIFPNTGNVVVFPNPVGDEFNVLLKNMTEGILHISLYNITGELVWRKRVGNFKGTDLIVVPTRQLPSGNYWVRVNKDEDPVIIKRILK